MYLTLIDSKNFLSKKILFVDDESDWRYMGTLYLSECGYAVVTAEDAAGAVKQAAQHPFFSLTASEPIQQHRHAESEDARRYK